ncbi:MAG: hypothetical protein RLZZ601_1549 [Pseudomonadota bacterium]|jgi:hypothetical protein
MSLKAPSPTSVLDVALQYFGNRMVITKEEVSTYLGYSHHTLQKMLEKKDTPLNDIFYKAGKSWVCDVRDLAGFIEADKHKHLDSSPLNMNGKARSPKHTHASQWRGQ